MSVKVNGKKLHLTTFEIPTTGKNIRACLVAQKELAKVNRTFKKVNVEDDDSLIEFLDSQEKMIDIYMGFLQPILKLSDEQVKKVDDSDFDDVVDFANEIIEKVLGWDGDKSKSKESK